VHKEGSGLGLSIVKGLVDRMGGNVVAESALGKGTTIRVSLAR
jgi:signal transduction histidine kinase